MKQATIDGFSANQVFGSFRLHTGKIQIADLWNGCVSVFADSERNLNLIVLIQARGNCEFQTVTGTNFRTRARNICEVRQVGFLRT